MLDDILLFTVTDLKQFTYCPRVVFYEQCLPHVRPRTFKMDAGRNAHEVEQKRAARRLMGQYGIEGGTRHFDVPFTVPELHLTGIVDEIIETPVAELIPVDYKLAKRIGDNHRIQLTAYALLIEYQKICTVTHGFIYLIPLRKTVRIDITPSLRNTVHTLIDKMYHMVIDEAYPETVATIQQCTNCEFRRFCNDV